jgi:hypothetical protein
VFGAVFHVLEYAHVRMVGGEVPGAEVGVPGDAADLGKVRRHGPTERKSHEDAPEAAAVRFT